MDGYGVSRQGEGTISVVADYFEATQAAEKYDADRIDLFDNGAVVRTWMWNGTEWEEA